MYPSLIQKALPPLKTLIGNIDEVALVNILNAKLANMVAQTGVNFRQYRNSKISVLSYYGINFMNSGASKDYAVDCINNYLMPFLEQELIKKIDIYKEQYRREQSLIRVGKKQEEAIEREIENIRTANYELHNPNITGLYREAEQIDKMHFGSLFIRIGELGDYLDNIVGGNQTKREFYQKLKDIYEGTIAPNIIAGDSKRPTLKQIPVQALMYTDFENLLDSKIKKYYITSLKTGIARRSFIYMPPDNNQKLQYPQKPAIKANSINELLQLQDEFYRLFKVLIDRIDKTYLFSTEANDKIYAYNCECIDYFNTSKDDSLIKIEKKESYWKITKLAAIYSIIDNPSSLLIEPQYIQMAIDFYNKIEPSLNTIINKREMTKVEQFAAFIANSSSDIITMSDLRKSGIINQNNFSKFIKENIDDIRDELQVSYNMSLFDYKGNRNTRGYQLVKSSKMSPEDLTGEEFYGDLDIINLET